MFNYEASSFGGDIVELIFEALLKLFARGFGRTDWSVCNGNDEICWPDILIFFVTMIIVAVVLVQIYKRRSQKKKD